MPARTILRLALGTALGALAFSASGGAAHAAETPLVLAKPPGVIEGTLTMPSGKGPFPVVLIVAGSGPTDRDGNAGAALRTDTYKLLAAGLAAQGVATVRYDKRGVAGSALAMKSEADVRFSTYVDDAIGWVEKLRKDARFSRVYLVGHSEGSLVAILAAQQTKVDGVVSLEGAGRPIPAILHEQLARGAPNLVAQSDAIAAQLQHGERVEDVPAELQSLYRPSVQPYLISWFGYDPAKEIARLTVPVTIVQGDDDIQVSAEDAKLLAAGNKSAKLVTVPGMSHTLKHVAGTGEADQKPAYFDPSLPVVPAVVDAIVAMTNSRTATTRATPSPAPHH